MKTAAAAVTLPARRSSIARISACPSTEKDSPRFSRFDAAAGWSEKNGTVTNSERCISRQRAFRAPPGEARSDWWMLSQVARRLGWGEAFAYRGPADIFREHAALSAFENDGRRLFDIGALAGLSDAEYDALEPVRWPLPVGARDGARRLFSGAPRFPTEDSKARFVPMPYRPPAEPPDEERPLVLNTGRVRDQWHTMTRTGRVKRLMTHRGEPTIEIHPADAERLGLMHDGLARVETRHGWAVLPVRPTSDQRPGDIFVPMHWTDEFVSAGPVGRLVGAATDPVSGQPELKATAACLTPVATFWHGLLLRRDGLPPTGSYYWARTPLGSGQAFDLAGWEPLPCGRDPENWLFALMGVAPGIEMVIYADPGRGVFRYAAIAEGRLEACLFLGRRRGELPTRAEASSGFGSELSAAARLSLLCGRTASEPSAGERTVCACFGTSLRSLNIAIAVQRLTTVAEIGSALRAGTNCGSCIPELNAVLRGC